MSILEQTTRQFAANNGYSCELIDGIVAITGKGKVACVPLAQIEYFVVESEAKSEPVKPTPPAPEPTKKPKTVSKKPTV